MSTLIIASVIISIPGIIVLASNSMETLLEIQGKLIKHDANEKRGAECNKLRIATAQLPGGKRLLVTVKHATTEEENKTLVIPEILMDALGLESGREIDLLIDNESIEAMIVEGNPEDSLAELYTSDPTGIGKIVKLDCYSKGITVVEEETNREISGNLRRITVILSVSIAVPVITLGLRAAESVSNELWVSRIIGVPRRSVLLATGLMGTALIPLLTALSISASLVFYNTALWISEYLTHTVIPRPLPSDTVEMVPIQLVLHTVMWTSILSWMYRRVD